MGIPRPAPLTRTLDMMQADYFALRMNFYLPRHAALHKHQILIAFNDLTIHCIYKVYDAFKNLRSHSFEIVIHPKGYFVMLVNVHSSIVFLKCIHFVYLLA